MSRINQICPACRQPKSACKATVHCYKVAQAASMSPRITLYDDRGYTIGELWERSDGEFVIIEPAYFDAARAGEDVPTRPLTDEDRAMIKKELQTRTSFPPSLQQLASRLCPACRQPKFACRAMAACYKAASRKAQIADDYNEGFGDGQDYASERVKSEYDSTAEQYGDSMIMELERLEIDFDTVPPNYDKGFKDGYKQRLQQETGIDLTEGGRFYSRHAQNLTYEGGQAFAEEMLLKGINTFGALQTELSSMIMDNLGKSTDQFADGYWDFLKASGEVLDAEHIARRAQGDPFQVGQKIEDMLASADPYKWWTIVERSNDEVLVKLDDNPTIQERLPVSELQERIQNNQIKLASRKAQATEEEEQFATEVAKKVTEFAATEEDVGQLMELIKGKSFAKESKRIAG